MQHLLVNNLIINEQHGFVPNKSCCTNLLETMDLITQAIDDDFPVDILFLDFAKAFDTVVHTRLSKKLIKYGFVDGLLAWLMAFLSNRFQRVILGENISEWIKVLSGVPQGSVLGPLLFIIFINDLISNIPDSCKCKLYADDTKILSIIRCNQDCDELQNAINKLVEWSNKWLLKFNKDKWKVMHIGRHNVEHKYFMDSNQLAKTELEKDLGVFVSKDLKWDDHINYMINKANRVLGLIKNSFSHLDTNSTKLLFTSLVRPHLEYGASIWNPTSVCKSKQIESVQRRATKITPLKGLTYQERLFVLNLPTLENRRLRGDLIEFFKIMKDKSNLHWHNPPRFMNSGRESKFHSLRIERQLTKVGSLRYNFLPNRVANKWNSLSQSAVDVNDLNQFKKAVDLAFFNNY